jgi:hypothetical protein
MRSLIVSIVLLAGFSTQALAEDHAVGFRVGMLGLGVEYAYRVSDRISVRGGLNGSGISFDETESGIDYGFDLDFDSVSVGVDVYPLKGKFRVSAGALKNDSGLSAIASPGQNYTIGDGTYTANEVGTLTGRIGFDNTAPYLAVGWDWLHDKKVGVALDIGLLKQGAPVVSMRADGPIASDPQFMDDLAAETLELQQSLDDLDVYPYAMFGVVVRF